MHIKNAQQLRWDVKFLRQFAGESKVLNLENTENLQIIDCSGTRLSITLKNALLAAAVGDAGSGSRASNRNSIFELTLNFRVRR